VPFGPLDLGSGIGFFPDPGSGSQIRPLLLRDEEKLFGGFKILQFCADLLKYFPIPVKKNLSV